MNQRRACSSPVVRELQVWEQSQEPQVCELINEARRGAHKLRHGAKRSCLNHYMHPPDPPTHV